MKRLLLMTFLWLTTLAAAHAQCKVAVETIDEFDSTRLVVSQPVNIGNMIPSNHRNADGMLMVEEAKLLFSFTENDTLGAFFFTIAAAEREYYATEEGYNVYLIMADGTLLEMMNYPDKGTMDDKTLMRIYTHTCVVPVQYFFIMADTYIDRIRILYKGHKRTIKLTPEQREEARKAIRCVGEKLYFYPIKP
ncbi:MAG TPA: hypothetical protein PLL53_13935 [Saprospiraceae bacterium]|nr:hypothetical protein [Saprospiraceae bacterium]